MGCSVSCVHRATMSLFGRHPSTSNDDRVILERKLYLARESPEPDYDVSGCKLRQVPPGIYSICKVYRKTHLHLQSNNLQSLEEGGQLSDLHLIQYLNISSNKFVSLPNTIRYLINLTELYIQNNYITYLPESIHFLKNLNILDVSNNRLKSLTPSLGKLKNLRKLSIIENKDLHHLCPELCFATNISLLELDGELFIFPPPDIASRGTTEIMTFLCHQMNTDYTPPLPMEHEFPSVPVIDSVKDSFHTGKTMSWEEQEATIAEQENKFHEAAKQQRERFLSQVLQDRLELDTEIAKIHEAKETERQRLIKAIQEDEKEIECLVKNFIQTDQLRPEVIQQQLAYDIAEHDRLLEITRKNYDNIKKADILTAMENLIKEDYFIQYARKEYDECIHNTKKNMLSHELQSVEKLEDLLKAKDQSRTNLVQQLLEDQDVQKAVVASLVERVDAKSWSLNQEISLISRHLARLSVIEQEKKKLHVACNYNDLLAQRMQLVTLLDDVLHQKNKRRMELIETLKEMENETDKTTDFWLKNYQKLIDFAPKTLLHVGKNLDPMLANYLLQEGVIHCLPFLVKFLFSDNNLTDITSEKLIQCGISQSSDRDGIIRAISYYVATKTNSSFYSCVSEVEPSAPSKSVIEDQNCTGVVSTTETENATVESECVVCMDSKCEVVFVPCGHMCCCHRCAQCDQEMVCCPMCRGNIERKIKVMVATSC
ncbi:E3 ubiquitin-protein ligase LRSAM1-like [Cydia strobilella]|uniref:E3 ubiquitin-protein ligase LRSAM1-like n=1 Tax=Cydia strobilella TaxID=1100964 RepID=UPI00300597E3